MLLQKKLIRNKYNKLNSVEGISLGVRGVVGVEVGVENKNKIQNN